MSDSWFRIGHTTRTDIQSGCTAIVFDEAAPAAVDVRGGAPGTRETTLLAPGNFGMLDALVLSGGSAFGLRTAEGVMQYLLEQERGYPTRVMPVPLVASAIIYDLGIGPAEAPSVADGYAAAKHARREPWEVGPVGAGTGATVAKITGSPVAGGFGIGRIALEDATVTAVVVLNAVGSVVNPADGAVLAGASTRSPLEDALQATSVQPAENTTIGCVLIDRPVSRRALVRCATSAHTGLARVVVPAHTPADGDTFFCAAPNVDEVDDGELFRLCVASQLAVERAIISIFQ